MSDSTIPCPRCGWHYFPEDLPDGGVCALCASGITDADTAAPGAGPLPAATVAAAGRVLERARRAELTREGVA